MPIFKQDHTDTFWELAPNVIGGPMWLNVHGAGHKAYQNECSFRNGFSELSQHSAKALFEADGFAPLTYEESEKRGDKYWSGDDPFKLVNPRQLQPIEVTELLKEFPVFQAPEPATPAL
jgi:hypothetical protein